MQIRLIIRRTRMLNSLVRSRIIYSFQTWSCTKAQLNKMNSLYMLFIRKITKGGYRGKVDSMTFGYSNDDLLKTAHTTDLNTFMKLQQRNYVCHIVRKDNSNRLFLTKILLQNADHKQLCFLKSLRLKNAHQWNCSEARCSRSTQEIWINNYKLCKNYNAYHYA